MKKVLLLEDGTSFPGEGFGAAGETMGWLHDERRVVGYQECLTDPDNRGCIVNMTYPLIGNYGVNGEDGESDRPQAAALVVKERSRIISNWRAAESLEALMERWGVVGLEGVDTRAVALHLRAHGEMRAIIAPAGSSIAALLAKVRAYEEPPPEGGDPRPETVPPFEAGEGPRVAVLDCGCRYGYLRQLKALSCRVRCFPPTATWEDIESSGADGLFVSNGPGSPEAMSAARRTLEEAMGRLPVFGVALGAQLLALAAGGSVMRMGLGHHGANYPVRNGATGKAEITLQNHSWVIDASTPMRRGCAVSYRNLNDGTVEGIRSDRERFFGVQFSPVPDDEGRPSALFREFVDMMNP